MKKTSLALITLAIAAAAWPNSAWGQSRIERDNAANGTTTQTNTQTQTRTGDNSSSSSTNTQTRTGSNGSSNSTNTQTNTTNPGTTTNTANNGARFTCERVSGELTVVYRPLSRPNEAYPWAIPSDMGTAWTSQRRCSDIARRLELYRPDGLQELRTGIENRQNVVCVTTEKNQSCRIVFTVPGRQDPIATRDQVFRNLTLADSGQQTQGVNTYAGGNDNILGRLDSRLGNLGGSGQPVARSNQRSSGLDLRPFLSTEDGGNGSRMGNPVQVPARYRLNPDNFR
jgi:Circadian oscillating protein COP23